eukprot:Nk52_evm17s223 gene=Nk52_evmTU17s223
MISLRTVAPRWGKFAPFLSRTVQNGGQSRSFSGAVGHSTESIVKIGNKRSISGNFMAIPCVGASRLFSTTRVSNSELIKGSESSSSSPAEIPVDLTVDGVTSTPETLGSALIQKGEVLAAGFEMSFPVGYVQHLIEFVGTTGHLSWAGAIIATTLLFRMAVFPIVVAGTRNNMRLSNIKPEMEELQGKMNTAFKQKNHLLAQDYSKKLKALMETHQCSPWKGLIGPLVQMPFFISFFLGIRRLAEAPAESFANGGMFWFPDLTVSDPTLALPVLASMSLLATMEVGVEGAKPAPGMKNFMRGMAVLMVPLTYSFPSGVFVYWNASNLFSLIQAGMLRTPLFKRAFNIPDAINHPASATKKETGGFFENAKAAYYAELEKQQEGPGARGNYRRPRPNN